MLADSNRSGRRGPLPQILHALLPGNGLLRTFPRASVRPSALTTHGQSQAMTNATIALDVTQPVNVLLGLLFVVHYQRVLVNPSSDQQLVGISETQLHP